jgi:hypothetical protein
MKIVYYEGPPRVGMGAAGEFRAGVAKEVADALAGRLLEKKSIRFYEEGKAPAKVVEKFKKQQKEG